MHRHAFTAIEMIVVLAILVMLAGVATPTLQDNLLRTRVQSGANMIQEMHREARRLARTEAPTPTTVNYYWVDITSTGVSVKYHNSAAAPNDVQIFSRTFPAGVVVVNDSGALGALSWAYQYRTGYPITIAKADGYAYSSISATTAALTDAINIGLNSGCTDLLSNSTNLQVRTVDSTPKGRHHAAIRIFKPGVCHVALE